MFYMKRFFAYLLISVMACLPCMADGEDEENNEVPMAQSTTGGGHNRSAAVTPTVFYNQSTGVLTVTFVADQTCTLQVTDSAAQMVCTAPVNADGLPNTYVLHLAAPDAYVITITSASEAFTGVLMLE